MELQRGQGKKKARGSQEEGYFGEGEIERLTNATSAQPQLCHTSVEFFLLGDTDDKRYSNLSFFILVR